MSAEIKRTVTFKLRRDSTVGAVSAETDERFLKSAFVDTGMLSILRDTANQQSVVLGRTGSGKSALLIRLQETEERVIRVQPNSLSMKYLSNSTIIPYLHSIGVRLDPFYQLLWRHVFVMELIRHHYKLDNEAVGKNIIQRMSNAVSGWTDSRKKRAFDYYKEWSPEFWLGADARVRQITEKLQEAVSTEIGSELKLPTGTMSAKATTGQEISQVISSELVRRAQEVVNKVSLQRIDDGMQIVKDDVLSDDKKRFYLVVDDLDRNWVEIAYAYDLIDALLDVVAEFAAIKNVKIVVALRENIADALHSSPSGRRQQREKQRDLFLPLRWTPRELKDLADKRVTELVRAQYGGPMKLDQLLPDPRKRDGKKAEDYMIERTFERPRDLIMFLNCCIQQAVADGNKSITWRVIETAEEKYSQQRLEALEDEWLDNYGPTLAITESIRGLDARFTIQDLSEDRLHSLLEAASQHATTSTSKDSDALASLYHSFEEKPESENIWAQALGVLYRMGVVGVKVKPSQPVTYRSPSFSINAGDLLSGLTLHIHPALWGALNVRRPPAD